jgi:5-formyltetrahydrofolate cyclo-ligase
MLAREMDTGAQTPRFGISPPGMPSAPLRASSGSLPTDKEGWRRHLLAARAARTDAERLADGRLLAASLAGSMRRSVRIVAAYAGVGTEPPTRVLVNAIVSTGRRVLLPVARADGVLDWAAYDGWDGLVPGPMGLLEPAGPCLGPGAIGSAELVLAPALAVDRTGNRLGRGAGYYDRALAEVDRGRVYAVVFDDEVVDTLPSDAHDRPVGAALTPSGVVPLRA